MDRNIHINMTPIVSEILKVFTQPYVELIAKLHADGRVSDAEVNALTDKLREKGDSVADIVAKALNAEEQADG